MKLELFHLSYFHGIFFGDDGFQNMFACKPIFNMLELKKTKVLCCWLEIRRFT